MGLYQSCSRFHWAQEWHRCWWRDTWALTLHGDSHSSKHPFHSKEATKRKRAKQTLPSLEATYCFMPPSYISPNFWASVWGEHQDLPSLLSIRQLHLLYFSFGLEPRPWDTACLPLLLQGGFALCFCVVLRCFPLMVFSKLWLFLLGLTGWGLGFHFLLHKTRRLPSGFWMMFPHWKHSVEEKSFMGAWWNKENSSPKYLEIIGK